MCIYVIRALKCLKLKLKTLPGKEEEETIIWPTDRTKGVLCLNSSCKFDKHT